MCHRCSNNWLLFKVSLVKDLLLQQAQHGVWCQTGKIKTGNQQPNWHNAMVRVTSILHPSLSWQNLRTDIFSDDWVIAALGQINLKSQIGLVSSFVYTVAASSHVVISWECNSRCLPWAKLQLTLVFCLTSNKLQNEESPQLPQIEFFFFSRAFVRR